MKKLFFYIAMMFFLHTFKVNGQIVVGKPQNSPFFIINSIVEGDTIVVDSIPSGLTGNVEMVIAQQGYVYKYNSGYGFKESYGNFFSLQKFSIIDGKLKLISASSIFAYEHKKLFESGLEIEFKDNGIEFRLPEEFYGVIILPYDFYADQKQLDCFLKFLTKSTVKRKREKYKYK